MKTNFTTSSGRTYRSVEVSNPHDQTNGYEIQYFVNESEFARVFNEIKSFFQTHPHLVKKEGIWIPLGETFSQAYEINARSKRVWKLLLNSKHAEENLTAEDREQIKATFQL